MRPVLQPEEDAESPQADAQPQPAHGRVPALPQEVHAQRLPQSAHGERPRRDGWIDGRIVGRTDIWNNSLSQRSSTLSKFVLSMNRRIGTFIQNRSKMAS